MKAGSDLWAIVVTFHPDSDVLRNLSALRPQVEHLVVVDNGSSAEELSPLREAAVRLGFELMENGANLGIATALNFGVRRAMDATRVPGDEGWILLFDQDSCVTEGLTGSMLQGFGSSRWGDRLGLLVPVYRDKRSGSDLLPDRIPTGGLEVAMTSGSLLRMSTLREHGLFADELFIDGVDHEYSLRLRAAGLMIDEFPGAVLLHSPGTPTEHRLPGAGCFQAANYAPVRRYFQERNKIWIYRRYFLRFPRYCTKLVKGSFKDFAKIVLVESGKGAKVRFFLRGVWDGLRGRMGGLPK